MRWAFASNLLLLLAANAVVKPLYLLGVELGVQNAVGTSAYGRYATWFAFAFLFGVLHDAGLQNYNAVTLSKSPELLKQRLPVMLGLKLGLSLLFTLIVLGAAALFGEPSWLDWQLVGLAVLYHVVLGLLQLLRTNLGAQERYGLNTVVSVADKALLVVVLGAVLLVPDWREQLTTRSFFMAQILALVFASVLALVFTKLPQDQAFLRFDRTASLELLRAAAPFGLLLVLSTAAAKVDIVMLERLQGPYPAGVYAGAYRLLDGTNMVGYMFATLLLPMLSKLVAERAPQLPLLRQASGYMLALGLGAAALTTFHADVVVGLLYREADAQWAMTLAVLMWASIGVGLTYIYGSYLLAHAQLRWVNWAYALALVANVALNAALIPPYGPLGAALATVCTQVAVSLAAALYARGLAPSGDGGASLPWLRGLGFGLACLALSYGLTLLHQSWYVLFALYAFVGGALALLTGLVDDPRLLVRRVRAR